MDRSAPENTPPKSIQPTSAEQPEQQVSEIASLLRSLDESALNSGLVADPRVVRHENHLAQVRLGIASSLFTALRCKHAGTAAHSMRVALGCSAWAIALDLEEHERDQLEVAALLHDVGKIGVPDHILQKPGKLTDDEGAVMDQHPTRGLEILGCCGSPTDLLEIVQYSSAWFNGKKPGYDLRGKEIPLGARMIAIVDAFDAMTTDHVYRRAMSRERALVELFEYAGRQFDPDLVRKFGELHEHNTTELHGRVSQRWLEDLAPETADQQWQLAAAAPAQLQINSQPLFQQKLLDNMHDGVVFIDSQMRISMWNQGMERLSGIAGSAASQKVWLPSLVQLRDERGSIIPDEDCPVAQAMDTGVQSIRRLSIAGRNGKDSPVDLHSIPVIGRDGTLYGATLMVHDASSESSLEHRCQALYSQATKDPMTQVANRAEFDRVHMLFLKTHTESRLPCSLIICDIDFFKSVNDNYGHQAGDDAIISFAKLLKNMCRHGDLVARYGGEEFVMLCADCNNATASARADQIRKTLAELQQPLMGGKRITASFGVTENQPGDTPETMLRRADRGLLEAKATGRNRVVQLGGGTSDEPAPKKKSWWPFGGGTLDALLKVQLVTNVPLEVAIEKLRGFVADHNAQIASTSDTRLELILDGSKLSPIRRSTDRAVPFSLELDFSQKHTNSTNAQGLTAGMHVQTHIQATVRPRRDRDRRREDASERARQLLNSLKSYLMAREETPNTESQTGASGSRPHQG
jgi:diguanylate cyclase (GGDEF)-like protein